MLPSARLRALGRATAASTMSSTVTLPAFLVPSLRTAPRRALSTTSPRQSKLGRQPITIPPGVDLVVGEPVVKEDLTTYLRLPRRTVNVSGPLGKLDLEFPHFMTIAYDDATRKVALAVEDRTIKKQREMWGTMWSLLNGYITGVSEGHTAILRLVGVGYRATVEERPALAEYPGQKFVCLKLGFTHPVEMGVPMGVTATTPQPTRILLEGINKEVVMSFAAKIRRWRRPEPYKGKGIFVNDETIKLKQKKIS